MAHPRSGGQVVDQCQQAVSRSRWCGVCRVGGCDCDSPSPCHDGCCLADANADFHLEGNVDRDAISPCCARPVPNRYGYARIRTHCDPYSTARYTNTHGYRYAFPYTFPLSFTFAFTFAFTIPHCNAQANTDTNICACCRIAPSTAARARSRGQGNRSGHVRMGR